MPTTITLPGSATTLVTASSVALDTAVSPGSPGVGVPAGGASGTFLRKQSADDYDMAWENLPYASSEQEGVAKMRLDGTVLYVRTDGVDA